ncbi:MAG: UpxY family transcription antiterminator [Saprospiraceae bacterium]|nr:UpxY family transcription antiterminator [Saprospiraceae bacterium]
MNTQTSYRTGIHLHEHEARWFAVYTRYKREKVIRKRLTDKGIESYLPLQQFVRHYTRKVKVVDLPLISCYLFVKITKQQYLQVLETADVLHFVRPAKDLIAIPEMEIDILRRVVGESINIEADRSGFQSGDEVEIIGGNLTGIKGILLENSSKHNFLIELNQIGYSLQMQVDPALLRRMASAKKMSTFGANAKTRERSAR